MDHSTLLETFITEASELVQDLEIDLLSLESSGEDDELVNKIFRAAHTIKGSAGVVGLNEISDFTHSMEGVLDLVREHKLPITSELVNALLKAVDLLKSMIKVAAEGEGEVDGREVSPVLKTLQTFLPSRPEEPAKEEKELSNQAIGGFSYLEIDMTLPENIFETGTDPLMIIKELQGLGEIIELSVNTESIPDLHSLDVYKLYLSWHIIIKTGQLLSEIENVFVFVQENSVISIEDVTHYFKDGVDVRVADMRLGEILTTKGLVSKKDLDEVLSSQHKIGELLVKSGKVSEDEVQNALQKQLKSREIQKSSTIRVDTDKLDKLVNLVGEMVIAVARVSQQQQNQLGSNKRIAQDAMESLERISRELQEQVMRVRMISVEGLFSRFHRVVRDLAADQGKQIRLELFGTETELDKNVIEQLSDPLKHLIRNAVDHGIEQPEERQKAGKPKEAKVKLSACQQEGNIIIEISDDGHGIDHEAVLDKAIEKGLLKPGMELSEQDTYQLMFMPGFSTAKQVTEVSGRGVGLDVVKQNIADLRGAIQVISSRGKGTTFRIKLPLTLAIIDGMNVKVGQETLTVPLLSILESIRPYKEAVKTVEGKGEVIDVRGEYLSLIRLHELFAIETDKTEPSEALVVIVESGQRKFGILVDDVIGQQQAVIKSLDKNFRQVDGSSGATILGDGTVSLILDIYGLEKMAFKSAGHGVVDKLRDEAA